MCVCVYKCGVPVLLAARYITVYIQNLLDGTVDLMTPDRRH